MVNWHFIAVWVFSRCGTVAVDNGRREGNGGIKYLWYFGSRATPLRNISAVTEKHFGEKTPLSRRCTSTTSYSSLTRAQMDMDIQCSNLWPANFLNMFWISRSIQSLQNEAKECR